MSNQSFAVAALAALLVVAGCGESSILPQDAGVGPKPALPEPVQRTIPTVNIAPATGWTGEAKPHPAAGLAVTAYAGGLDHPRWLYVLPNGDVLVAETNAPERPEEGKGIKGWFFKQFQRKAGAGVKSANRITLLRDADGDGVAETRTAFIEGLKSPFGMALIGDTLYVANTDAVVRFPYREGDTRIDAKGEKVADLPGGPLNHHWTKNIIASRDGSRLYATSGSNSDHAENGIDKEERRAAIIEINLADGSTRVFASGLRNPNGLGWEPQSGALWTVVNERDELGSDLVPDYLTSVQENGFYGWPYSYWGRHLDPRVKTQRPELVTKAIVPDYALGTHVAPLGLVFARGDLLPQHFRSGAFVGLHGSWNRQPASGYKVVFVPFVDGHPSGRPLDVLTGFLDAQGFARGRPVGVAIDRAGALLVADDVGNAVWRVAPAAATVGARSR
jgi:glucose/arabinose dehydrogenase